MNVETGTAPSASAATTPASAQQAVQAQKTSSDKSFQDELKNVQKTESEEKKDSKPDNIQDPESTNEKESDNNAEYSTFNKGLLPGEHTLNNQGSSLGLYGEISDNTMLDENGFAVNNGISLKNDGMSLKDNVQTFLKNNGVLQLNNMNNMYQFKGIDKSLNASKPAIDYSSVKMDDNDAKFFADLVQNTDMSMQNVAAEIQKAADTGNVQQIQKSANVSAALMNALSDAVKTNQPVRIDFDKDVSVIIRVDKDGSITANFIPGDKAVEQYLKENMAALRQRFDSQDISYKELSYSNSKQQQNQRRNNKENK